MPVAERFVSINGEGACAGKLAAFVRFTGCNLRCGYCDTMWANVPGAAAKGETPEQLAAWVRQTGVECVTLTGGEPVLQPLLPQLVELLLGEPGPCERGLRVRSRRTAPLTWENLPRCARVSATLHPGCSLSP